MRLSPLALILLLGSSAAPPVVAAGRIADPAAGLRQARREAEQALAEHETQVAESRYRTALAEGWILAGLVAEADGRYVEAASAFETASASAVANRRPSILLALARLRLGEAGGAIALLRDVLARHPGDRQARSALAQALVAAGRPAEAVQELEEALALAPADTETAFNLATGYLRLGEVGKAEPLLARLAAERPTAETYVLLGRTYRDVNEFARAREALGRALAANPSAPRAHYYLGTTELLGGGRDGIEAAIAHFERELSRAPEDPLGNLYLGTALAESRRFEEAVRALAIAARSPETRFNALRFLGRCLLALDRVPEAAAAFSEAIDLGTAAGASERQLGSSHYQLGVALRRGGDEEAARHHFDLAKRFAADQVEGERERFSSFLGEALEGGDQERALAAPSQDPLLAGLGAEERRRLAREVATELARAYLNLGLLATRAGRPRRAVEAFERAAGLDPDFPQLQALLGAAYFAKGDFEASTAPLARAVEADPSRRDLRRTLALAWLNTERYGEAAALLAADDERQVNPSLQYAYGLALVRSGRAAEAGPVFDQLLAGHGDWPELHVLLGQAHAQEGDFPAAIGSLERALELNPEVPEAHATLGGIYLRQGRLDEAEAALRSAVAAHPNDLSSRYHLATVLDLNRKPEEARPLLEAVLKAKPDFADARYLLGKILLAQGLADEAATQLESAAREAPGDANIHYQLAQAYQRLGKTDLAGRAFKAYRDLKQGGRGDGR
jgi:tetratricopeptide (TPR) repeat protein